MMKAATTLTYFESPAGPLSAHFFVPGDFVPGQSRPTLVFFHGGFWDHSMPTQFVPQCLHFAARGAIAVSVETRVESSHGTGPIEALADAAIFAAWLAEHGDNFGVDPAKLVLAGAAGGAWLALQQVLPKLPKDAPAPPLTPAAVLLFSALLDTQAPSVAEKFPDAATARARSPLRQVRRKLPPMLLCHGIADRMTPYANARKFAKALRWRRNRIELAGFENAEHSFFNFNVSEHHYEFTLKIADRFLADLGILAAEDDGVAADSGARPLRGPAPTSDAGGL